MSIKYDFPQNEYNYLMKLYVFTKGNSWKNDTNWNFNNFTLYNPCLQPWYGLTVQCQDSSQGGISGVKKISLSYNLLNGQLPPLSDFALLNLFDVTSNHLYGTLPPITNVPTLQEFRVMFNSLHGSIPDDLVDKVSCQSLKTLDLSYNTFTGTLPTWVYTSTNLAYLYLNNNLFQGTISSQIGKLPLSIAWFGPNSFEGSILSSLSATTSLMMLSIRENDFQEPFPETFASSTRMLMSVDATKNHLTGSLPSWICNKGFLLSMTQLLVPYNQLTGTLPACFANKLQKFSTLFLNNNHFSGSLTTTFETPSNFAALTTLTLGFNSFSGSFPMTLFKFPKLNLLSAMVNCFEGSLDESICDAPDLLSPTIGLINLDGLNAAPSCIHKIGVFPSYYTNRMVGSLPWCLWGELTNLQVMYLAGNGFEGSIPSEFNEKSKINMLSLSHNYFTGTIPLSMQRTRFRTLDLSYNKFTGNVQEITNISVASGQGFFNLTNNRLSGSLSSTFTHANNINILYDNVFACNQHIPVNDPNYGNYFCGSSALDNATYSFTLVVIFMVVIFGYWFRRFIKMNFTSDFFPSCRISINLFKVFLSSLLSSEVLDRNNEMIPEQKKTNIRHVFWTLDKVISLNVYIGEIFLFVLLPLYLILNTVSSSMRMYEYEYSWIHTGSYLTGVIPSILLLIFWILIVLVFESYLIATHQTKFGDQMTFLSKARYLFQKLGISNRNLFKPLVSRDCPNDPESEMLKDDKCENSNENGEENINDDLNETSNKSQSYFLYYVCYFSLLLIDIVITVIVNIFYLSSLEENSDARHEILVQMGMALFKLGWNSIIVTSILSALKTFSHFSSNTYRLRVFFLVFNIILAPCFAAIVYDTSCFHDLFFGTPELVPVSVFSDITSPADMSNYKESAFTLPWMYYYSCGSHILMSYIPVFLYSYSFLPVKLILEIAIFSNLNEKYLGYLPHLVRNGIHGILRVYNDENPVHIQAGGSFSPLLPRLFRSDTVMANFVLHFSLLLSFGFTSPLLGLLIIFVMIFECIVWKRLILRFLYGTRKETKIPKQEGDDSTILENVLLLHPGETIQRHSPQEARLVERFDTLNSSLQSNEWILLYHPRWRIFYVSVFFMSLLLFDFVGDEQGVIAALWAPFTILSFCFLVRFFLTDSLLALRRASSEKHPVDTPVPSSIVRGLGSLSGNNSL